MTNGQARPACAPLAHASACSIGGNGEHHPAMRACTEIADTSAYKKHVARPAMESSHAASAGRVRA